MSIKKLLVSSLALLMIAGVGASANNVNVNARHRRTHRVYRRAVVPPHYRHTYYGKAWGTDKLEYRVYGNYAYLADNVRAHHHNHWTRYRLSRGHHGWIRTLNNQTMPTPFKLVGNHIVAQYDTQRVAMYR